ncbi:MAG: hypothetical protein AABX93_00195 [Nanoarchaeota archaeon]
MVSLERKTDFLKVHIVILALGFGTIIGINAYNQYSENREMEARKILEKEKCRDTVYGEHGTNLKNSSVIPIMIRAWDGEEFPEISKIKDSDIIEYVIKINNLPSSIISYNANILLPVYSEERCKAIEAKKPKSYSETTMGWKK